MSGLWIGLKRDRVWADLYYKGEKIATIKVSEHNRGISSILNFECDDTFRFKIVKATEAQSVVVDDESVYNSESYNK